MWRKLLVSTLLAAITHTQMMALTGGSQAQPAVEDQTTSHSQLAEALQATQPPPGPSADTHGALHDPAVSSYERYDRLRRGREEEVAVFLCLPNRYHHCQLYPPSPQTGINPLTMELKPAQGFTVRYRQGGEFRLQQQGEAVQTRKGMVFRLKVRADKDIALGRHQLEGTLTFRAVGADGVWETRRVDVLIPIVVVEHYAHVQESTWSLNGRSLHQTRRLLVAILLAPVLVPIVLLWIAACEFSGPNGC